MYYRLLHIFGKIGYSYLYCDFSC